MEVSKNGRIQGHKYRWQLQTDLQAELLWCVVLSTEVLFLTDIFIPAKWKLRMSAVSPGNKIKAVCESCLHAVFIVQKAFYNARQKKQQKQLRSLQRFFFSSVLKYTLLKNAKPVKLSPTGSINYHRCAHHSPSHCLLKSISNFNWLSSPLGWKQMFLLLL